MLYHSFFLYYLSLKQFHRKTAIMTFACLITLFSKFPYEYNHRSKIKLVYFPSLGTLITNSAISSSDVHMTDEVLPNSAPLTITKIASLLKHFYPHPNDTKQRPNNTRATDRIEVNKQILIFSGIKRTFLLFLHSILLYLTLSTWYPSMPPPGISTLCDPPMVNISSSERRYVTRATNFFDKRPRPQPKQTWHRGLWETADAGEAISRRIVCILIVLGDLLNNKQASIEKIKNIEPVMVFLGKRNWK